MAINQDTVLYTKNQLSRILRKDVRCLPEMSHVCHVEMGGKKIKVYPYPETYMVRDAKPASKKS